MTKQNPDLFLIKIGDGSDPLVFSDLCGMNSRNLTVGGDEVDVTTISCTESAGNAWRDVMHGLRQVSFSGSGYFENKAQSQALIANKLTGNGIDDFQVVVPGIGVFEGKFLIGDLGVGAEINGGAVTQEIALSSAGEISFTPEA